MKMGVLVFVQSDIWELAKLFKGMDYSKGMGLGCLSLSTGG